MIKYCIQNIKSGCLMISAFFFGMGYGTSQNLDYSSFFSSCQVKGSITIYDYNNKEWLYSDENDATRSTLPASTFKIFNSLVALEEKVVKDENDVIKWDGKDRGNTNWNADTDLKGAFKNSTLWFYQEIARRVGKDKYANYLTKCSYGNMSTGKEVDKFWIDGSLTITPYNQISFLIQLYENKLPFSVDVQEKVKEIMIYETTNEYVLRAKTGWGFDDNDNIGWWVGYFQMKNNLYFFATRITSPKDKENESFASCRKTITYEVMGQLGYIH